MAERRLSVKNPSFSGTRIGGNNFDLINVDLSREHPPASLIKMVRENPGELVVRTNQSTATYIRKLINSHLEECPDVCFEPQEEIKSY